MIPRHEGRMTPRPGRAAIHDPVEVWEGLAAPGSAGAALLGGRRPIDFALVRSYLKGPQAQVAELVDALASGASARKGVEVRVFSWAPDHLSRSAIALGLSAVQRAKPHEHRR